MRGKIGNRIENPTMSRNTVRSTTPIVPEPLAVRPSPLLAGAGALVLAFVTPPLYVGPHLGATPMPTPSFRFQPRVERLDGPLAELSLVEACARLAAHRRDLALFEGCGTTASVLAFDPLPVRLPRSLTGLRRFVERLEPVAGDPVPGPFHGGFAGALAYELDASALGLALPADPWGLPALVGGLHTDFLVRDDGERVTWLVLGEEPGDGRPGVRERSRTLREELARPAPDSPCVARGPLVRR